jgi:hypothetical protein
LRARELTLDFVVQPKDSASGEAPATLTVPKMPLRMTGMNPPAAPAPMLGQHTAQVLGPIDKALKNKPTIQSKL